jgi:DNA polymerase III subunit chi
MTRIDFHLNVENHLQYTCRLIRKAFSQGMKVVCFGTNIRLLEELDDLLWTFSEDDFLPHVMTGHPEIHNTPIILTNQVEDISHYDLLINLDNYCPPFFARFDRLIEIVGIDETNKKLARDRYRFYKERGYPLNTFDRSKTQARN